MPAHAQRMSSLLASDKEFAFCRVERHMRCAVRKDVGRRQCKRHARGGPDSRLWGRARAERTANMVPMLMTLDVSKLSGWLNADAPCRVEGRACDAGRGAAREA